MFTTLQGRVASNPMLVPAPASMSTGRSFEFAEVLDQVVEARPPVEDTVSAAAEPQTAEELPQETATAADREPRPELEDPTATPDGWHAEPSTGHTAATGLQADAQVSELPEEARTPTTVTGIQQPAARAGDSAKPPESTGHAFLPASAYMPAQAAPAAPVANKAAAEGMLRGLEGAWSKQGSPTRATAVAAGYRTSNAAAAQRMDMARESVFQQILLKLHEGGGEMRLRLDPPEFGELDLRLVLHEGNKLSLSIAAERQEMAQLLHKHLDQLRQTLESAGMQVTDAQVGTRDQHHGGREASPPLWHDHDVTEAKPTSSMARSGGYLHADGLDFWV